MIARAVVALGGGNLTPTDHAAGRLGDCERGEFVGEGATWAQATAAANVPADALILYWMRGD